MTVVSINTSKTLRGPQRSSSKSLRKSRVSGFYKLNREDKLHAVSAATGLSYSDLSLLLNDGKIDYTICDSLVENSLGALPLPLGLMTNLKMNGEEYLVPMAVEESSVIAAAGNAARIVFDAGGFQARTISRLMVGQIQMLDLPREEIALALRKLEDKKALLLAQANSFHPRMLERGGGVKDIEFRSFAHEKFPYAVLHVLVDCCDAMGANLINTICEGLAPTLERITGARVGLRILSNLCDRRLYQAVADIPVDLLKLENKEFSFKGKDVARRMEEAWYFADTDPYRATTHNKGIMNGVDPVVIATGNDWRAIEAGAHAYAAKDGRYRSLSKFTFIEDENILRAELTLPLQVGTVGGVTKLNPYANLSLKILGNPSADVLSQIMVCTGLASNIAALRALVTTGIQSGHMRLHAKNLALAAGATKEECETVSQLMIDNNNINLQAAEQYLELLRNSQNV